MKQKNRIAAVAALLLAGTAGLVEGGEAKTFLEPGRLELGANAAVLLVLKNPVVQ